MTLILSLIHPNGVIQVADRRVTWPDGRVVNDDTVKSVVLSNQMVFGFTGLATIWNEKTDYWLATKLSQLSKTSTIQEACDWIEYSATDAFRKLPLDMISKRLAFVGVGFTLQSMTSSAKPIFVRISNFHDQHGNEFPYARDHFTCVSCIAEKNILGCWPTPQWLTKSEYDYIDRMLSRIVSKTIGPWPYIRTFTDLIRTVSARLEISKGPNAHRVGKSVLVTVIFRPLTDSNDVILRGPGNTWYGSIEMANEKDVMTRLGEVASTEQPWFLFIPEDSNNSEYCGPHFVSPGSFAMAGVKFWPRILTPSEIQADYHRTRPWA